jgi:hypothetical protein
MLCREIFKHFFLEKFSSRFFAAKFSSRFYAVKFSSDFFRWQSSTTPILLYIDENCAEDPTFHLKQLADVQGIAATKVWSQLQAGVDVMITIFCDFRQFSAKKLAFFLKNQFID